MEKENRGAIYELPLYIKSRMNWRFRAIFILSIILVSFFVCLLIYLSISKIGIEFEGIVFLIFFLVLDAFFVYTFFYYDIAKKGFIEITDEYIQFRDIYKLHKLLWSEIDSVGTYTLKGNTILGFILKKNLNKKKSLWKKANSALGDPYDVRLPLTMFSGADIYKLLLTIQTQIYNNR